jgi:hypothetical protein
MAVINSLVGPSPDAVDTPASADIAPTAGDDGVPDGTEWAVAILVLGALAFLILFKYAGFQTVIAAKVSVG